ncbi:MAG: DUF6298 domain-containing protein [Planctomycetota bacterium]
MDRREFLSKSARLGLGLWLAGRGAAWPREAAPKKPARPPAAGPLRVHPENPRYFTDGTGRAVYLAGSHTWSNLVDIGPSDPPPRFDFAAFLDWAEALGHNCIRLWTWELATWNTKENGEDRVHTAAPHPFARTGPGLALDGKPKFDLTRFDPEYFKRLRSRIAAARDRGFYVSVMLFEGWGIQFSLGAWEGHPFHPKNAVNGIDADRDGDGKGLEIHTLADKNVTAIQEAYVEKVIDTVNDLDNVLYEISNEAHPGSTEWQYHMIDFVHAREREKAKQHPVGMTFQYRGGSNRTLFESPADWISPNPEGGYRDDPPANDGKKVILNDTDHLWGIGGNQAWVWKSFLRGLNPLFMDPYDGAVLGKPRDIRWEPVRKALGHTLAFARKIDLASLKPENALASSGYCLANPGREYVVYVPSGGSVSVDLTAAKGELVAGWFDPTRGTYAGSGPIVGGRRLDFAVPFPGDAVLHIATRPHPPAEKPAERPPARSP